MQPLAPRALVGLAAPEFTAEAYFPDRVETGTISLADARGQWLLLNFYSSDFTFV